jgi:hypothetical protein
MKNILFCLLLFIASATCLKAQLQNPSFEENGQPTLEGWVDYYCDFATSENDASPNGGQWCVKMQPGQTQGCYPGFFYQKLPTVSNGQVFQLEGWAKVDSEGPVVGIYLGRKDPEGTIHLLEGDTTSSENWTMLSVVDTFELEPGDVAVVVINSGLVGGPVGPSLSSYFDDLHLDLVTSIDKIFFDDLKIFPNPVVDSWLNIDLDPKLTPIEETLIFDITGRLVYKSFGYVNSVNVADWNAGIYCLKLKSSKKEVIKKFVIN